MAEFVVWVLLVGTAITIAGMWMLSSRIKKHMKDTVEIILLILAELKRLTPLTHPVGSEVGVVLERRCRNRRARTVQTSQRAGLADQRKSPGRRREDFAAVT